MLHDRKPNLEKSGFCGTGIAQNGNDRHIRQQYFGHKNASYNFG